MSVEFATEVVRRLVNAGYVAYWAGGCVRDLLRGAVPHDYDVATSATPAQVRELFGSRRTLAVGESFGVVIVLGSRGSGEKIEVATFRREGPYHDGRRPEHVEFCSPREDAGRRDFTINGMFFDPLTQTVHDFVGGQQDLERQLIRAIGRPHDRMQEDKLRMLRAVRFAAAFDFALDPETATAISEMSDEVTIVSAERIAQELRKMLGHPHRARAMELCIQLGIMPVILPEVTQIFSATTSPAWERRRELLAQLGLVDFESAFAALLREVPLEDPRSSRQKSKAADTSTVQSICHRLRLSNEEADRIVWFREQAGVIPELPRAELARVKRLAAQIDFKNLLHIEQTVARVAGEDSAAYEWVADFLKATPPEEINPLPLLSGRELLAAGYPSGPDFKVWLTAVRDAQLNNQIATTAEALELVRQLAESR